MAIHEFRESISIDDNISVPEFSYKLYQKKINLRSGMRHTVNFIDFYDDSQFAALTGDNEGYLFYVSKYPVIPTELILAEIFANAGPPASDPNVIFKASLVKGAATTPVVQDEFPNQFLGASPTFNFYTEHVYLTLILYAATASEFQDPQMSVYMAIDSVECNTVEYMMGYYREFTEAQLIQKLNQGTLQPLSPEAQMGYSFPMWLAGGIRPERMLRADALADWWHNLDGNFAEKTQTVTNLREYYDASKQMVRFDAAFGLDDAAKGGIPDWIRLTALPSVVSGPERSEFPIAILPTSTQIAAGVSPVQIMT
tara:strand:+ start:1009 stop:1944 length:936 start_codon:yes stop_codon:yes gene_type:complete